MGGSKTFLKRKSKNPSVMQSKCTWKVESKIDCWVKDRTSKQSGIRNSAKSPRFNEAS